MSKKTTITSRYNHLVEHLETLLRDLEARNLALDDFRRDPNEDGILCDVQELYATWQTKCGGSYYG